MRGRKPTRLLEMHYLGVKTNLTPGMAEPRKPRLVLDGTRVFEDRDLVLIEEYSVLRHRRLL